MELHCNSKTENIPNYAIADNSEITYTKQENQCGKFLYLGLE